MQETRTFRPIHTEQVKASPRAATRTVSTVSVSPYPRLAKKIAHRIRIQALLYMVAFFLLPTVLPKSSYTVMLTVIFPIVCFILSTLYGMRYGFISHYLALPLIVFLPAAFAFFAKFSFLYAACYLLTSLVALTFGALIKQSLK